MLRVRHQRWTKVFNEGLIARLICSELSDNAEERKNFFALNIDELLWQALFRRFVCLTDCERQCSV
jgi:hypothetical protein